jgi:hypothetical protein
MRDFDECNITHSVIERFANTPNPRLKLIMQQLVQYLHDFIRDVDLTFDEWRFAIAVRNPKLARQLRVPTNRITNILNGQRAHR